MHAGRIVSHACAAFACGKPLGVQFVRYAGIGFNPGYQALNLLVRHSDIGRAALAAVPFLFTDRFCDCHAYFSSHP